ncbi:sporulation protein YpjB [Paenibacillus hodogayensis]|uniref:Sporulation protein YpjB n=1 Tax=Paenibacillus hodogayensis TaxID=279208 RepID=A0ABV5W4K2_9BACL
MFVFGNGRLGWSSLAVLLVLLVLAGCVKKEQSVEQGNPVSPEQLRQAAQLNAAADELYRYMMDGDIEKARDKLEQLGSKMTEIRFEGMTSVEGVSALSETIVQAKRVLQSVHVTPEEGQAAVAKIRLATDALTHANQPMWLQYYKGMKEAADQLGQAVQLRDRGTAAKQLEELQFRYNTIRPSLLISRQPFQVEKMDSLMAFMRGRLSGAESDLQQLGGALEHLRLTLDELFQRTDRSAYVPMVEPEVPMASVVLLGSVIVAILSFAAWRIFDFERNSFGGGNRRGGR